MSSKYNLEILAPAGSYDIFTADIAAGADAVYLGGDMFGARAYAGNFGKDELLKALDYAHIRGKKIYLTVNTLLKERELHGLLVDYLAPYYEAGLDAVIVQDMGVFRTVKENFPDLPIHASTQMTVTGSEGAKILERMGASRVVTARELNLAEIKKIHDTCSVEIESFVHGALCYCYSGQCLFSSMNGARSGNRGRCAQPCRMAYDVLHNNGQIINGREEAYALSPKDMCALNILPDVAEAGVYSLKIEGRMKNVTYAAGVTAMYRKYVDMLNEYGKDGYKVSKRDIEELMDMYNRGAFTSGYYNNSKGKSMMSLNRPNHMGTKALEVIGNQSGRVTFKALKDINKQDVFEIDGENSFTSGEDIKAGKQLVVNLPKKYNLHKGRELYRTRNGSIAARIVDDYVSKEKKTYVNMSLFVQVGQPLKLILDTEIDGTVFTVVEDGNQVQPAVKQPAIQEKLAGQISKLGNTEYVAKDVYVELLGDAFVPVGELNDIKRRAVDALTKAILDNYKRTSSKRLAEAEKTVHNRETHASKSVLVKDYLKLTEALAEQDVTDIYIEYTMLRDICDEVSSQADDSVVNKKRIILALPHMLREKNNYRCKELIKDAVSVGIDTFLIRNLEELGLLSEVWQECGREYSAKVVTDANLYVWNSKALKQFKDMTEDLGLELLRVTLPYELKKEELALIVSVDTSIELVVYGRIPLMVSEQCVRKTYGLCNSADDIIFIRDRKGQINKVKSYCDYCYSVVYSHLYDISCESTEGINPDVVRYEYMDDKDMDITNIIDGHFNVGVE